MTARPPADLDPARASADRAIQAYEALAAAESFGAARSAWEDYLIHWRRALNRCEVAGRRKSKAYAAPITRVTLDPALAYLWAARNADEHGVAPISVPQESIIALGSFGGYEEGVRTDEAGRQVYTYTPTSDDPPPFFAFVPEHLRLQPVTERGKLHAVPRGYDYDLGEIFAVVTLAVYGLDFLQREIADLQAGSTQIAATDPT